MGLLGIDIGTSMTKAVLFDESGQVRASASRPVVLRHPRPGHVEQDVEQVIDSVDAAVAQVIGSAGPAPVVAVTGQGDGCWLVDSSARPVRAAVSWMDGRAAAITDRWQLDGTAAGLYACNGNTVFPGSMAPILAWLDEREPQALDRAVTAAHCKDVVFQRFTGVRATDPSDASLPFGDLAGTGYALDALRVSGLEHRSALLAPVAAPVPVAPVRGSRFGGPALMTSGPFDLPACAIGAGLERPGDGLLVVGTTLGCEVLVDHVDTTLPAAGMHVAMPTPQRWMRVMAAMAGCACLDWMLGVLGYAHADLDAALAASPAGAGGVGVLPYLAPSGERAPFVNPLADGRISGLRLTTSRADLVRATCEGLAYAARDCFEAAGLTGRLVVCGGGARSRPWLQIFASVLGRPLEVARGVEVGSRGAVLAAMDALDMPCDRRAWTRPEAVVEPDPAEVELYAEGYARFVRHRDEVVRPGTAPRSVPAGGVVPLRT